jgi:hypothetical protein
MPLYQEAATGSGPSIEACASLRRHAMVAAAYFAAQAQVEIEDEALALIAEFMIAVTLSDDQKSVLPQAVMAAARFLFAQDELNVARAHLEFEDEGEARLRARKTVEGFFAEVGSGDHNQTLKPIHKRVRLCSGSCAPAPSRGVRR